MRGDVERGTSIHQQNRVSLKSISIAQHVAACLVVFSLMLVETARAQSTNLQVPETLSIPKDYVPKSISRQTSYFMGLSRFRGVLVGEIDGVYPIYVSSKPTQRLSKNPFQKGDLIVGVDGAGLGNDPMRQWNTAFKGSKGPNGDWTVNISRWRKGKLTTFDFDIPRPKTEPPPPDLTKGDKVPEKDLRFNMGPTGVTCWFHFKHGHSSQSRQILVTRVDEGSPADGILTAGDVILGADGTGAKGDPPLFASDARKCVAYAIGDAEARKPAILRLLRWRAGNTSTVALKLETLGTYSDTAPYQCLKSRALLRKGVAALCRGDDPGRYGWGILPLLAADDPADPNNDRNQAKAREWAHRLILPEGTSLEFRSGDRDAWSHGFKMIILGEYYLKTRDKALLPTLRAYAEFYASHQSWFGTTGHRYSEPAPDGSTNGAMDGYGALGLSGVHGLLGLSLARKAGIQSPSINAAIRRGVYFFGSYAFKGTIPYGEHPYAYKDDTDINGKCAATALALRVLNVRRRESQFFSKVATRSYDDRDMSHAGPFFNSVWPALGAAAIGEKPAAYYFKGSRWHFDLCRRWDHRVTNLGPSHGKYNAFSQEITTLLTYALPLRNLYVTGRDQDKSDWLTDSAFKEIMAAEDFDPVEFDPEQLTESLPGLIQSFKSWSPRVRYMAATEIAQRTEALPSTEQGTVLAAMHSLAASAKYPSLIRAAACIVLRDLAAPSSLPVLVGLLEDSDSYVRFWAATALQSFEREAVMPHIDAILAAAAHSLKPTFPLREDDPLQLAHGAIAELLFDRRKGLLPRSMEGVNRDFLWPAVRAVARTPAGHARSSLVNAYKLLTKDETLEIADTIVESVLNRSPADAMFSKGIRQVGIDVLHRYAIAEGAHLAEVYTSRQSYQLLSDYGPAVMHADPDGKILQKLCQRLVTQGDSVDDVRTTLVAILSPQKKEPKSLTFLKRIESVTAAVQELTLPKAQTVLEVKATNYALRDEKDTIYTWRKVHGAGAVHFVPNGTWESKKTDVVFAGRRPGKYRFELTMSDTLGYTVARDTVDVTLLGPNGRLPPNKPPVARSLSVSASPGIPLPVRLSGSDPEGEDLGFVIRKKPSHGTLSGAAPNIRYTADWLYTGADTFTFDVLDGQGAKATGTVRVTVQPKAMPLTVYEGFDYKPGPFHEQAGSSEIGLLGAWSAKQLRYKMTDIAHGYAPLPSVGSGMLTGWGDLSRAMDVSVLSADGLLTNGNQLWFSVMLCLGKKHNCHNSKMTFELRDGSDDRTDAVGFSFTDRTTLYATVNGNKGKSHVSRKLPEKLWPKEQAHMVIGRCTWGKTDSDPDTVEIYRVIDLPGRGPTFVDRPVASHSGVVDQAQLNSLHIYQNSGYLLDEIRIGPTYQSVLVGNVSSRSGTKHSL